MELSDLNLYLSYFTASTLILPISVGVIIWKSLQINYKYFVVGLCLYFLLSLIPFVSKFLHIPKTNIISYIVSATDCLTFTWCFSYAFKNKKLANYLKYIAVFICFLTLFDIVMILNQKDFLLKSLNIKSIFKIFVILLFLIKLFQSSKAKSLREIPLFLIAIIELLAVSIGFAIDGINPYLLENKMFDMYMIIYSIYFAAQGVFNLLYSIPLWKASHDSKSTHLQV